MASGEGAAAAAVTGRGGFGYHGSQMYIVTREGIQALIRRLQDPAQAPGCRGELEKIVEIKGALAFRAEAPPSYSARLAMSPGLHEEARLLREALDALDRGGFEEAASLLEEFYRESERNLSFPW